MEQTEPGHGLEIYGSHNQVIHNVIAGNNAYGISITKQTQSDPIPTGNVIDNNFIGTRGGGNAAIPNDESGIVINGQKLWLHRTQFRAIPATESMFGMIGISLGTIKSERTQAARRRRRTAKAEF